MNRFLFGYFGALIKEGRRVRDPSLRAILTPSPLGSPNHSYAHFTFHVALVPPSSFFPMILNAAMLVCHDYAV